MEWNEKGLDIKYHEPGWMAERGIRRGWEHDVTSPLRWSVKVGRLRAMPEIMRNAKHNRFWLPRRTPDIIHRIDMNMVFTAPGSLSCNH